MSTTHNILTEIYFPSGLAVKVGDVGVRQTGKLCKVNYHEVEPKSELAYNINSAFDILFEKVARGGNIYLSF